MSEELANDIAAAWPEDDDLTLAGANQEENDDAIQPEEPADEAGGELPASGGSDDDSDTGDEEPVRADHEKDTEGEERAEQEVDAAPMSLPPAAREAWKDTPAAMREAVALREQQYEQGIRKYAHQAKRAMDMDKRLSPFAQFFALNNNDPGGTVESVLKTASILQMGTPMQKASMVKDLITNFGVDIQTLDNMLVGGEAPPEQQIQSQVQQQVQQALQPYQQQMNQQRMLEQQRQQQLEQETLGEVERFATDPKNEFYNQVSDLMADLMDLEASKGNNLTLQQAYDKAVQMTPQVQATIQSRQTQETMQKKRAAASSVAGSPSGADVAQVPESLRGGIEAAWNAASRP